MKETGSRLLLDSSAWVEYFLTKHKTLVEFIESGKFGVFSSVLSLHEVKKKFLRDGYTKKEMNTALEFMRNNSVIVDLTEEICEKSAEDCIQKKLHTIDSMIYRSAKEKNAGIVTLDEDFRKTENAVLL